MRRLAALLLAALLLAGCAVQARPEEPEEGGWDLYQQPEEEPEPPKEPDYPAAFSMAYHRDRTLDPVTCAGGVQEDVAALLYEPLFRLDPSFEPEPVLCESWEWDESGLVCTLTLRGDVFFSDGSPLSAADAAETLQRAMASERYAYRLRKVASVSASRSGQVVIALTEPDRGLLSLLDIPIVKRGTGDSLAPVGTGPYRFVSREGEEYLEANPDWWQQKPLPVDTIPLVHAKDRDTAMYLFSTRRIEFLTVDPTDDLGAVAGQYEAAHQPTTVLQFVGFNTRAGLFADAGARSAFSRGIPRETLATAQMAGLALAAQFPISPLSALYPAGLEVPYDRDAASAALAALLREPEGSEEPEEAADGEDGGEAASPHSLSLLVNEEDAFRLTSARFLADSLSLGGWTVEVRALPWEEYLLALEAGDFDLYYGEVRLTADWDLTDLVGTDGALNYGGYADELTDTLLQAFSAGLDRTGNAKNLSARLLAEAPIAPVCFRSYTVLTHPGVAEGLEPSPSTPFYRLERWSVRLGGAEEGGRP